MSRIETISITDDEEVTDMPGAERESRATTSRASMLRSVSPPPTKRRVGDYRIVALLGEGGMAQVHLAIKHGPAGFTKLLVVKSMRDELVDPIYVKSFMHEARLAAQLNHPNVVQTYEVSEDAGRLFIAMEYVEGQSFRGLQRRLAPKRLPLNIQLRILAEVARGLHHAHTLKKFDGTPLGIVHRDVSPQNVMLSYDGQVKLLDFGIAKMQGSDELTRDGMIKGKIDYMAPEQLRGENIDHRADTFALGVMLWEALTGARFSGGAEVAEVTKMHNRIVGKEPKLRDVAPDTPMRLVEICEKAIALDPKDRHESAEEFATAIYEYLAETSKMTDARQLAKVIETLFESEHKKMREMVEEQLRLMSSPDVDEDAIAVPVLMTPEPVSGTPHSRSGLLVQSVETNTRSRTTESTLDRPFARVAIAMVVTAATVGGLFGVFGLPGKGARGHAAPPGPRAAAPASAPSAAPVTHVRFEATPANATAEFDGSPVALPFDRRLARDDHFHTLVVRAPGFEATERVFGLGQDQLLHVDLVPTQVAAIAAPTSGSRGSSARSRPDSRAVAVEAPRVEVAPAPPPPAPVATPTPTTPTRRAPVIESDDPYAGN